MPKSERMDSPTPYNPLALDAIAHSIETTLLQQAAVQLPLSEKFAGSGVYLIYYEGGFEPYLPISSTGHERPIYVGKSSAPGARQGRADTTAKSTTLHDRIRQHAASIDSAQNLSISDFRCRYLVVESFFIPLGEQLLIRHFKPLWNQVVDGFGNHNPGKGRRAGKRSDWDMLHPGRPWAGDFPEGNSIESIVAKIDSHFEELQSLFSPEGSSHTPIPPPPDSPH